MTDSIESAARYVIEFHTAAAWFFSFVSLFQSNFLLAQISWRVMCPVAGIVFFFSISQIFAINFSEFC